MLKKIGTFFVVAAFVLPCVVSAQTGYRYKKPSDFKTLESFKSVAAFEASFGGYVRDCLDSTGGGTGGIECFIGTEMWDREMNIYYGRLMKALGKKEKSLLRESQLAWISERDKTRGFNSALLDRKYGEEEGTMYSLMRAGDASDVITPIVKQRALLLRSWLEGLKEKAPDM